MNSLIKEPALQYSLFEAEGKEAVVNVASVPQRSPFRYPGGKTWLIPRLRQWLRSRPGSRPVRLVEPFAGGGIVSLTTAFERLADRVTMVEKDEDVAAVWQVILDGRAETLGERILRYRLTPEAVAETLAREPEDLCDHAFQTILRNRVNRGGILAPGSGRIKNGENGRGIASRWYPETLRNRIMDIASVASRIDFIQGDGLEVIERFADDPDAVFFIDPPYTAAGKRAGARLYRYNDLDHERLFQLAGQVAGDFLMTYDHAEGVLEMARRHGFSTYAIPMKTTHHAELTELLIGRNLEWV